MLVEDGRGFFERFTKGGPRGWHSFDQAGVHFVRLNNVQDLKGGGMGSLGADQLAWPCPTSTPGSLTTSLR